MTNFKTFLSLMVFYGLPIELSPYNILIFLEFLTKNHLSPKVVRNYLASLSSVAQFYNFDTSATAHPAVHRFLRSLSIKSTFRPTPQGVFDIWTMYDISKACDSLQDPTQFRAIFLVAFYASRQFSHSRHFLWHVKCCIVMYK